MLADDFSRAATAATARCGALVVAPKGKRGSERTLVHACGFPLESTNGLVPDDGPHHDDDVSYPTMKLMFLTLLPGGTVSTTPELLRRKAAD